jgi:glycosyltransferase involved in cell wall biosynthesis
MRVGIVTGEYPPMQGGVGAYSQILAKTFAQQGHSVCVLSDHRAREDHTSISLTNTVTKWRFGELRAINRWASANKLDIFSLQFETAAYAMSHWIHFLPNIAHRTPIVTTFHDLLPPYLFPKAGKLRDWIVMRLAGSSAGVIATNHEDMQRIDHLPLAKIIPIGSNIIASITSEFNRNKWRRKAGADGDDFLLAYFGFINRSKGVDILLLAIARLRESGCRVKLVMIGGRFGSSDPTNTLYANEMDTLIAKLGLQNAIHWTGFVEDSQVSNYLEACDLVVLPYQDGASYRRGSLMAAIQHGCAIATTEPSVNIPAFSNGKNMALVPRDDPMELADAIQRLMNAPDAIQRLRDGSQALRTLFDWGTIAKDYVSFFEAVVRKTGAKP